jgi:fibronectin-binding autotransporter adhesin
MTLKYGLLSAGLAALFFATAAGAATYTSKSNGNYSVDSTWNEGGNPGVGATSDTVTINAPHTVTVTNKYTASNDVVIVNPGATFRTPMSNALSQFLAGAKIELRGGTLSTDVREWEGQQNGSRITVASNSVIDTYDSYSYPQTLGHEIFGTLVVLPGVTKVTFTNSIWDAPPYEIACFSFTNGISISNSVEFCAETPKAYVELNNLSIDSNKVLTKTGSGRLQIKGTTSGKGTIVVNEGTIEPLVVKCLGTNELTLNPGTTLFIDYLSGGTALQDLPITLNGGTINYGYNSWAQTLRGQLLVKSNATINMYCYNVALNGNYNAFDTLAFGADPSGAGYELRCTQLGGHANWSNTVIGSKFAFSSTISNNAVINADKYAGLWFDKALVLATNKTLTKKGEGVLTFNGVFTNAGTLAVEGGVASLFSLAVNNSSATLANNATGTASLTVTGSVYGVGDLVLSNNSAIVTGITLSTASITNLGRIVNSGTGSGSVLISAAIGTNVNGVVQASGSSPLILSGVNSYSGGTVIASGKLIVSNAAGFAIGLGPVSVNNGGTLQGNGAAAGAVTNSHGGTVSPGFDGVAGGTLTMGNMTWNGGGILKIEVGSLANNETGAGIDYDQIVVTNALTAVPGGSNLVIRLDSLGQTLAFETNRNYSLKLITCGKSATLSPADVTLDTNAFLAGGTWVVTNLNNAIYVVSLGATSGNKNYWRGTGNWSTATNWSLGHAPLAGEDVEFDLMGAANCAVDLANNNLGAMTLAAGYTGTVVFLTKFPAQGGFTNLAIAGDVTVLGGALSHGANTTGEVYRLALTVGGNLTVPSGSRITADSQGFSAINGPGKQIVGSCSGSHGGLGYPYGYTASYIPGPSYGTITAPTNCGSGGNATAGGGAIRISVAGTSTVSGVISADGNGSAANYSGAGGSVFLTTGFLTGSGTIRANGGYVSANRSGAGGRVAVILTNSASVGSVSLQAYPGGSPGGMHGSGGTVYLEGMGQTPGQGKLIVDYGKLRIGNSVNCTPQNGLSPSSYAFSEVVLTNGGVYALDTNDVLDITGTTLRGDPANRDDGIYVLGGTLTVPAAFAFSNTFVAVSTNATFNPTVSLTVDTNATMRFDVPWVVTYPITLKAGGWMGHSPNSSTEAIKLNLTINNNLDIQPGGQVNVDGMGYAATFGPGTGNCGSHGGQGSKYSSTHPVGPTYGSITAPTNCGSGGGVSGGGAARLLVTGTTTVNGVMSANGTTVDHYGGAGGSIFLTTGVLLGSGTIRADGSRMLNAAAASSGGGRVAVILTNASDFATVNMDASAGVGGNKPGAAGTIYLETQAQGPGKGTLVIDATNIVAASVDTMIPMTLISSQVTDTVVGTVIVTNKAILSINTNQSMTVNGSWSNAATFIGRTNSTVILAGPGSATVTGSNAFYNLIITNADKVVSFQAGRTNLVAGLLKLGSAVPGANVTLQSTVDGSWWYVNLTTNASGTQQIARVTVKDSHAGGGQLLTAPKGSVDGGHNINWKFPKNAGTVIWVR